MKGWGEWLNSRCMCSWACTCICSKKWQLFLVQALNCQSVYRVAVVLSWFYLLNLVFGELFLHLS